MFNKTSDGSIEDRNGRVLYFSFDRFISDIVEGSHCFICGAAPSTTQFNDEHVLPDWMLRRHRLYDRVIKIPNQTEFRYSQFKIPCCMQCNSLLGKTLEEPIREMFSKGYESFWQQLNQNGPWLLFTWMSLIFLKTHLKDKSLRFHRDLRREDVKISDLYSWEELHHIHCICRSFYTQCDLDAKVCGSLLVLPAKTRAHFESFDYGDLYLAQTTLLRSDDIAVIVVFNDSCAAANLYADKLRNISAPLSPVQLRELSARIAFINVNLQERPRFCSDVDLLNEKYRISCQAPLFVSLRDWDDGMFGKLLYFVCQGFLSSATADPHILENVRNGKWTFLFDSNDHFIQDSMELLPTASPKPPTGQTP